MASSNILSTAPSSSFCPQQVVCSCDVCQYIVTEGFQKGECSDIVIAVMGKQFNLHRFILMRSPYFRALLCGRWKESLQKEIHLDIDDENITLEAVTLALKSLYTDRVNDITENNQFSVLAAAEFFQLDSLTKQCVEYIINHLNPKNIVKSSIFADRYKARQELTNGCVHWMTLYLSDTSKIDNYWEIPLRLFQSLIENNQLWIKSEFQRYRLATNYVNALVQSQASQVQQIPTQIQSQRQPENSNETDTTDMIQTMSSNGYKGLAIQEERDGNLKEKSSKRRKVSSEPKTDKENKKTKTPMKMSNISNIDESKLPLLERTDGESFLDLFKAIHYVHMKPDEIASIKEDNIIPTQWINEIYQYHYHLLTNTLDVYYQQCGHPDNNNNNNNDNNEPSKPSHTAITATGGSNNINTVKNDKYSCRLGFEFRDIDRLASHIDTDEEISSSEFYFAGSKWKLIIGIGQKDEDMESENWFFCELCRLSIDEEQHTETKSPFRNINKKHTVSYHIILLPATNVQHVYAFAQEISLKEGCKDGGYWICRYHQLSNYLFQDPSTGEKILRIIFCMKHLS